IDINILGGGHSLILTLAGHPYSLLPLILLFIVRFSFSMISYGAGLPGGIFLPILTLGAIIGAIFANISTYLFHFDLIFVINIIIFSMAGYFTAIGKAPLTGSILITEMVGNFEHLMPIAVVSLVAYITADSLGAKPIYEALLQKMIGKRTITIKGKKQIIEIAIPTGCILDEAMVQEINWPRECLLAAIHRGDHEIIPHGNTVMKSGDILIVLTDEGSTAFVKYE